MALPLYKLIELEGRRSAASMAGNVKALEAMLHPDFFFIHSNGRVDTRETYLDLVGSGDVAYLRVDSQDHRMVASLDLMAIMFMQLDLEAQYLGTLIKSRTLVMSVWALDGGTWKLLALQSTRVEEANGEGS